MERLIITRQGDDNVGLICDTELCRTIHKPNGCYNCPMFAAIKKKLKFFEDAVEEMKNEELQQSTDSNTCCPTA